MYEITKSVSVQCVIVPSYNLVTVGRQAFPVSAANLWNSLPVHHTSSPSLTVSGSVLRLLSRRSYPDLIIWHSEFTFRCVDLAVTLLFRPHQKCRWWWWWRRWYGIGQI